MSQTNQPKKLHIMRPRPAVIPETSESNGIAIPEHYLIMNAPRPLYSSFAPGVIPNTLNPNGYPMAWVDEFMHGRFYVAVDPAEARVIDENTGLDGWVIIYHTPDEAHTWVTQWAKDHGVDVADFEERDILQSFILHVQRKDPGGEEKTNENS